MLDDVAEAFIRGPVSIFLGTADEMGTPDATRVAGLAILDGSHLRALIAADAHAARNNARIGAQVAVIVTDITNYRSVQWKGHVTATPASKSTGDTVLTDRLLHAFAGGAAAVGLDPTDSWRLFPVDVVPLVIRVESAFDQSPGRRAGQELRGSA